jgi:hypothetical protein
LPFGVGHAEWPSFSLIRCDGVGLRYGGAVVVSYLFVHSPLVGPSSLRRLADLAGAGGTQVALPDLTPMATAADPHHNYTSRAIEAAGDLVSPVAVIGHSGAGPFLPTIGAAIGSTTVLVFVDAVVPPKAGSHRTPDPMREMLDQQTVNGTLRWWLDWWPPEVVAEILPDPADRELLAADMPNLPRALYDHDVAVPPRWSEQPCGYVQLSTAYDADHAEAIARGWPTQQLATTHLATVTEPSEVLEAIRGVIDQII